jgi:hypothetical protein
MKKKQELRWLWSKHPEAHLALFFFETLNISWAAAPDFYSKSEIYFKNQKI